MRRQDVGRKAGDQEGCVTLNPVWNVQSTPCFLIAGGPRIVLGASSQLVVHATPPPPPSHARVCIFEEGGGGRVEVGVIVVV